jgi:hypothetical protein
MRATRTLLIAIVAAVAALSGAAALRKDAALAGALEPLPSPSYAAVRVTAHPERAELLISVHDMQLPACGDGAHAAFSLQVPTAGWLRGYEVFLTDRNGERLPHDLLHHLNLFAPSEPELFMPLMRRVVGAGTETGRVHMPPLLGYRMSAGDSLLLVVMLHNRHARDFGAATVHVRLSYVPVRSRVPRIGVVPFYLDVMMEPTPTRSFAVPPGRTEVSWSGSPAVPGRILGLGGHLHEHAVALRLEDVTTGKLIWETRPRVDAAGNITAVPVRQFITRLGVPVRPDHTYRITAIYRNDTQDVISGMGVIGGIFAPAKGAVWPPVDRTAAVYARDRLNVVTGTVDADAPANGGYEPHTAAHDHGGAESATCRPGSSSGGHLSRNSSETHAGTSSPVSVFTTVGELALVHVEKLKILLQHENVLGAIIAGEGSHELRF